MSTGGLLASGLALAGTGAVAYVALRHQRLFLTLFLYLVALESTRDFDPALTFGFSEFSIYPRDVFTLVAASAAAARLGHLNLGTGGRRAAMVLAVLTTLGVLSWVNRLGVEGGVNPWREQMLGVALLLYAASRPRDWEWRDLSFIVVGPAVLAAILGMTGALIHGLGSSSDVILVDGVAQGSRPLFATGSLLLLLGMWVLAIPSRRWTVSRFLTILLLGGMVLITQNRSVWVAGLISIAIWWAMPKTRYVRALTDESGKRLIRAALIFFAMAATAIISVSVGSIGESARDATTWMWRVARWTDSMEIDRTWVEWLLGSAFGPTPAFRPGLFETSAHSLYLNAIEITGVLGLGATVWLLVSIRGKGLRPYPATLGLVICSVYLFFGITYQLPAWAWAMVGILLSSPDVLRLVSPIRSGGSQRIRKGSQLVS